MLDHICFSFQTTYRGVKNPEAVERKRKKQEEIEKQEMTSSVSGGGGLKVRKSNLTINQNFITPAPDKIVRHLKLS